MHAVTCGVPDNYRRILRKKIRLTIAWLEAIEAVCKHKDHSMSSRMVVNN